MDVRLPSGKVIRGVPDGTPKEEIARKAIAAGLATEQDFGMAAASPQAAQQPPAAQQQQPQPQQQRGFFGRAADAITGGDRQTPETQQLQPIGSAPELNRLSLEAAKTGVVQTLGSEQAFVNRLKDMGANIVPDEKGNLIAELPSGRYLVNPPGLDPADVARGVGQAGAFLLGSRLSPQTIPGQIVGGGVTSAALQGATELAGGGEGISPTQVGVDAALGGAGQLAGDLIGGAGRLFTRGTPTDESAAQAAQFARQQNVPIMTSDVAPPTTFAGRSAQSLAEKVPLAGTAGMRETQQEARQQLIRDVAERYGEPSIDDVAKSLSMNANKVRKAAGSRIQSTQQMLEGRPMPLNNTTQAIDNLITNMTQPGKAFDPAVVNRLQEFKQAITQAPNDLELLRQNRTYFREFIKGDSPVLGSQADRANKVIYDAMTKDMAEGVAQELGPEAARKLRQADAVYAQEVSSIKNTRLKNILAKGNETPELVSNMLFSKRPSEVGQLYRTLDQQGRQNARAAVVHKAIEQFAKNDSPEAFLNQMKKMGPQIEIMFKGKDRAQLKGLMNYLEHTKRAGQASLVTPTGQQLFQLGAVGDIVYTGGAGTAGAAGIGALARAYESKPVTALMLRLSRETPGSEQFERLSREMTRALTAEMQKQTE